MRQFQCVPTTYVPTTYITENKETIFKFTLKPSIMSIAFASFKHLKLPISIIIPVTINSLLKSDKMLGQPRILVIFHNLFH